MIVLWGPACVRERGPFTKDFALWNKHIEMGLVAYKIANIYIGRLKKKIYLLQR